MTLWTDEERLRYQPLPHPLLDRVYHALASNAPEARIPFLEGYLLDYLMNGDGSAFKRVMDNDGPAAALHFLEELAVLKAFGENVSYR